MPYFWWFIQSAAYPSYRNFYIWISMRSIVFLNCCEHLSYIFLFSSSSAWLSCLLPFSPISVRLSRPNSQLLSGAHCSISSNGETPREQFIPSVDVSPYTLVHGRSWSVGHLGNFAWGNAMFCTFQMESNSSTDKSYKCKGKKYICHLLWHIDAKSVHKFPTEKKAG